MILQRIKPRHQSNERHIRWNAKFIADFSSGFGVGAKPVKIKSVGDDVPSAGPVSQTFVNFAPRFGVHDDCVGLGGKPRQQPYGGGPVGGGSAPAKPKRKKPTGPDRRQFLRNAWLASWGGVAGAFGLSALGFIWPRLGGGFGAVINLGSVDTVLGQIADSGGRLEYPAGRLYMVAYDASKDSDGVYAELNGESPAMAIYQKCVHLGCRVPWCETSKWFECPCHGSRYNRWGEYQFGPAPRGLDRFPTEVRDGNIFVNTGQVVTGPTRTTQALGEPAAGPNCNG